MPKAAPRCLRQPGKSGTGGMCRQFQPGPPPTDLVVEDITVGDGAMDQVRNPIGFSRTPVVDYRRPPGLGEHTEAVRAALNSQHRRD